MMAGLGHNHGPTMEKGGAWQRFAWKKARAELLPKMPIEVVRRRVRRARELGIDYKSYAGIRAATGRDIIALLFSSNALRLMKDAGIAPDRIVQLEAVTSAELLAFVHVPFNAKLVVARNDVLVRAERAPTIANNWRETRAKVLALKGALPADGVVVVGETALEADWSEAGRLAGFLPADQYFNSVGSKPA